MKIRLLALILLTVLALTACAAATEANTTLSYDNKGGGGPAPSAPASGDAAPAKVPQPSTVDPSVPSVAERLVIKNASLEIVVESPVTALQSISTMAQQMNGFVVNSSSFKAASSAGSEVPQAKITVRVPADKLDEALAKIHALVKNTDQDIRNESVTGRYGDWPSRVRQSCLRHGSTIL